MSLEFNDRNALVSMAVDVARNKNVSTTYSKDETLTALHKALIDANNGKTSFDLRDIRDHKCNGLFAIIEDIISATEDDHLLDIPLWNELVEYKNVALGDKNSFYVPDDSYFYVSRIADGTAGTIRQRLSNGKSFEVQTNTYEVKFYDELIRVLSGRTSIDEFINKTSKSFARKKIELVLTSFLGITTSNPTNIFEVSSTGYSEDALLDLCVKVEAKNFTAPTILGTKKALRNIKIDSTLIAEKAKEDLYEMGYFGKFFGYNCVYIPNSLQRNNVDFYLPDDTISVINTLGDKPIKFVNEGNPYVFTSELNKNADLSQDFSTLEKFGCGIVLGGKKNGVYKIA